PRWTRSAARRCCSSASSRASATSRPTSTSISSTSGARRCCSTSIASTVASAPRSPRPSSCTGRAARCATSPRPLASVPPTAAGWRGSCNGVMGARRLPLASELVAFPGFPRHLSQHIGGFVISEGLLEELVPIENAAMPERTVVQWDKDDLNDLKLLKVDLLALGMLTALKRAFALVKDFRGTRHALGELPAEDPRVYAMISRADTIGVFQIESRAQMAMLPRLKPQCYYDLVIEVAIVRPG